MSEFFFSIRKALYFTIFNKFSCMMLITIINVWRLDSLMIPCPTVMQVTAVMPCAFVLLRMQPFVGTRPTKWLIDTLCLFPKYPNSCPESSDM